MFKYTTGDLLKSDADCLVNTVNCEGYMGKGIAYQFKLLFPENNKDYIKACKSGYLKIGTIHHFFENGKTIINFPTKDKWRAKSKIEYIEIGLKEVIKLIPTLNIQSIAIPPLGSGNGGLQWIEVRPLIEQYLKPLSENIDIVIYEPSIPTFRAVPIVEPKLSLSALVLIQIKEHLKCFNAFRLQKAAFFMTIFLNESYFKFQKHKFGPYNNSITIVSKKIKEFQQYHNVNTKEAYSIAYQRIISNKTEQKMKKMQPSIIKGTNYVNTIKTDHELECLSTILFLFLINKQMTTDEIVSNFKKWSKDKATRFDSTEIIKGINKLHKDKLLEHTLTGYCLSNII